MESFRLTNLNTGECLDFDTEPDVRAYIAENKITQSDFDLHRCDYFKSDDSIILNFAERKDGGLSLVIRDKKDPGFLAVVGSVGFFGKRRHLAPKE